MHSIVDAGFSGTAEKEKFIRFSAFIIFLLKTTLLLSIFNVNKLEISTLKICLQTCNRCWHMQIFKLPFVFSISVMFWRKMNTNTDWKGKHNYYFLLSGGKFSANMCVSDVTKSSKDTVYFVSGHVIESFCSDKRNNFPGNITND